MNNKEFQNILLSMLDYLQNYANLCEEYPERIYRESLDDHDFNEDVILSNHSDYINHLQKEIGVENLECFFEFLGEAYRFLGTIENRGIKDILVNFGLEDIWIERIKHKK